jgi:uncharacterized RDD family membrane protein YckC
MDALGDKLTIETPEQIDLEYEIAGPGSRFMALFMDLMLQVVFFLFMGFFLLIFGASLTAFGEGKWALAIWIFLMFAIQWGYFAGFEIFWNGQTPGKRYANIRVINESGRAASVYEAVTRNLMRAVDSIPGVYAVGAIVMFISPQNKRLGDYVAGTIVVHDRKPEDDGFFFNTKESEVRSDIDCKSMTADDLHLLETFLNRRLDLPLALRADTAKKLAEHFAQKCAVKAEERKDDENFLEVLVRSIRRTGRYR